jgi:hypothetical protein
MDHVLERPSDQRAGRPGTKPGISRARCRPQAISLRATRQTKPRSEYMLRRAETPEITFLDPGAEADVFTFG